MSRASGSGGNYGCNNVLLQLWTCRQQPPVINRATGCSLNDPWRFTVTDNGDIYTTDAGNADYEEINGPIALATASTGANSVNFGFPCFENNDQLSVRHQPPRAGIHACTRLAVGNIICTYVHAPSTCLLRRLAGCRRTSP